MYKIRMPGPPITRPCCMTTNIEHAELGKDMTIDAWDIDKFPKMRPLYAHYYKACDAVIFIIDANDRDRLDEVKKYILEMLEDVKDMDCPILFFANKQDLKTALSCEELIKKLDLNNVIKNRKWYMQGIHATSGDGIYEGFDFFAKLLKIGKVLEFPDMKKSSYVYKVKDRNYADLPYHKKLKEKNCNNEIKDVWIVSERKGNTLIIENLRTKEKKTVSNNHFDVERM
eukprot:UN27877